jgi:energy-coupling factor transporter ATP-binding protein EcfA2
MPGRTVALLGLSGAGKSTLANLLADAEILATGAVRGDGSGERVLVDGSPWIALLGCDYGAPLTFRSSGAMRPRGPSRRSSK